MALQEQFDQIEELNLDDPVIRAGYVYQLWWNWANLELFIISPNIEPITPPLIVKPELIPGTHDDYEFVYDIHDYGYKLMTSKSEDMFTSGKSMCKLFYTIEKMIAMLVQRLKTGGTSGEEEVQIALDGHEQAKRKAFESIINVVDFNIIVANYDPGTWGERYLAAVKNFSAKGLGVPPTAPRGVYRQHTTHMAPPKARF